MSASFCDCVNQWKQVLGLQVLKDTKHLSVRTRRVMDSCLIFQNRLCRLWVQYNLHAPAGRRSFSSSALNLKHFRINLNINEYQDMMIWSHPQVSQTRKVWLFVSQQFTGAESEVCCPPLDRAGNKPLRRFHNPAFFWLKAPTTAFTLKNLC